MDRKLERQLSKVHADWGRQRANRIPAERRQGVPVAWPLTPPKPGEPVILTDRGMRTCLGVMFMLVPLGFPFIIFSQPDQPGTNAVLWVVTAVFGIAAFWLLWGKRTVRFSPDGLRVTSHLWPRRTERLELPRSEITGLRCDSIVEIDSEGSETQYWLWIASKADTEHGVCYTVQPDDMPKLYEHVRDLWGLGGNDARE